MSSDELCGGELSWVSSCPMVNCLAVNCVVVKCLVVNCVVVKCGELSWVSIYPVGKLPGAELHRDKLSYTHQPCM